MAGRCYSLHLRTFIYNRVAPDVQQVFERSYDCQPSVHHTAMGADPDLPDLVSASMTCLQIPIGLKVEASHACQLHMHVEGMTETCSVPYSALVLNSFVLSPSIQRGTAKACKDVLLHACML